MQIEPEPEAFLARLEDIASRPRPNVALGDAGLDEWHVSGEPDGGVERGAVVDPRTGDTLRQVVFAASRTPSPEYPDGWPFLPGIDAVHTEVGVGTQSLAALYWPNLTHAHGVRAAVERAIRQAGWVRWSEDRRGAGDVEAPGAGPVFFHRAGRWRLLAVTAVDDALAVVLMTATPPCGEPPTS